MTSTTDFRREDGMFSGEMVLGVPIVGASLFALVEASLYAIGQPIVNPAVGVLIFTVSFVVMGAVEWFRKEKASRTVPTRRNPE
ncbi:MAG: hypothetical protein E6R04_06580 [Spirochaetes bacterium]|nr:MAG: hypothetical protein E6R04_06580 [Spirochaetota bacterium]